jgi:GPH family glycoside/pentoside/hexuronide:cation symporter
MSFIPAAFAVLAVIIMFFYNLDNTKLIQIQADLEARKTT